MMAGVIFDLRSWVSSGSICSLCVSTNVEVGEPLSDVAGQKGVSIADGG